MNAFFASIGHNLRRLVDFSGRETQIQFFPYAGLVYGLATFATMVITMAPMVTAFMRMMQQIAEVQQEGKPEQLFTKLGPLVPDYAGIVVPIAMINALTLLLLASAVVRRLHDKERTGFWGLLPVPFMLLGVMLMPYTVPRLDLGTAVAPGPVMALASLNGMVSFGAFVLLVVLLIGKGTAGPNRYGPETGSIG